MKKFIIPAVVALVALGIWQRGAIREAFETRGMSEDEKTEWELKEEGAIKEDGEVDVDDEFDKDLNEMDHEMNGADASGSDELDDLETEE